MATLAEIMALKEQSNPYRGLAQLGNTVADIMRTRKEKQETETAKENQAQAASLLAQASQSPEQGQQLFAQAYNLAPKFVSGFVKAQKDRIGGDAKPFQMGTGEMTGWSFNPNTNEWSLDENVQSFLSRKAEKKAAEGKELNVSDIKGINSDLTQIIKEPLGIVNSYEKLGTLKKNSSPAAKLAAVFAFMKSIDPSSVVREEEQGQVYAAQGAGKQLAGKINSLLGEGELSEYGFQDLVDTAKALADNAIDSTNRSVDSYLSAYGDKLSDEDKRRFKGRIPTYKGYSDKNKGVDKSNTNTAPEQAVRYLMENPNLAEQFKAKYGYLPEGFNG